MWIGRSIVAYHMDILITIIVDRDGMLATVSSFVLLPLLAIDALYSAHVTVSSESRHSYREREKGFKGRMKRWGFKGMSASHGALLSHRDIGSTG